MWWAGNKLTDVYLGTQAYAVCESGEVVISAEVEGFDRAIRGIEQWLCSAPPRRRLRVWLSGGLCRPFIVPQIAGVSRDDEIRTVARAIASQRTGLKGPCTVLVERSPTAGSAIAIALEDAQVRRVHTLVASDRSARLLSLRPWWADALRYSLAARPNLVALGVQDCDSMTVFVGRELGSFDAASTYSPISDRANAHSVLTRALLSANVSEGLEVAVNHIALRTVKNTQRIAGLALGALAEDNQ